jgi:hypothetical protein
MSKGNKKVVKELAAAKLGELPPQIQKDIKRASKGDPALRWRMAEATARHMQSTPPPPTTPREVWKQLTEEGRTWEAAQYLNQNLHKILGRG